MSLEKMRSAEELATKVHQFVYAKTCEMIDSGNGDISIEISVREDRLVLKCPNQPWVVIPTTEPRRR